MSAIDGIEAWVDADENEVKTRTEMVWKEWGSRTAGTSEKLTTKDTENTEEGEQARAIIKNQQVGCNRLWARR